MKKLEIKLRHFEELEAIMDREREAVSLMCGPFFCFGLKQMVFHLFFVAEINNCFNYDLFNLILLEYFCICVIVATLFTIPFC